RNSSKFHFRGFEAVILAWFLTFSPAWPNSFPEIGAIELFNSAASCSTFVTIWRYPGPRRQLANQLFNAGSSIGANLEESRAAYSRRELAAKNAIALKESREANYWLRLAESKSLGDPHMRAWLQQESGEFVGMLTASVRKLRS